MPRIGPTGNDPPVCYIGIDPGASGGLAALDGAAPGGVRTMLGMASLSFTERSIWDWLQDMLLHSVGRNFAPGACFAVIEKNSGYVGGAGNPGSAMFKFGKSYGLLTMALIAASIPYEEATPGVWQRALGVPPRKHGESKGAFKNRLKTRAQQLFPQVKVTLATADALLIAEYCRRKREGKL